MALNTIGLGFIFTSKDLVSKDVGGLVKGFDTLEKAVAKFAGTERVMLRDARGRFAGVRQELTAEGKQIVSGIKNLGAGFVTFKAGISGLKAFGPAINDANAFGKAIKEVSTLVDEASFSTATMRAITMSMAEEFGVDAFQQAPALYQAISAGASDVTSATELMAASNKLAIGGVTELTTSVDVLSTAVNVYKDRGLSAADASDTLFVAIRAGKTTAGELARSLGSVLPIASSMGISFAEVNASVAAMTANGLQTSRAVTGLNAALANVTKPTKAAKEEAERLGIQFDAAAIRTKGLQGFLDSVTGSAKYNKDSLSQLFGSVEGLNAITSLTSNNSARFKDVMGQMAARAGATDMAFGKMSKGLGFQINRLSALRRNLRITVGEAIAPFVQIFVSGLVRIVAAFQALPKPVQQAIALIGFLGSVIVAATGAFIAMRGAVMLMGPAFRAMMLSMGPALLPLLKIGLLIGVVIGAAYLLKRAFDQNLGGFGDEMRSIFADLQPAFVELKNAVMDAFSAWLDAVRPLFPVFHAVMRFGIQVMIVGLKVLAGVIRLLAKVFKEVALVLAGAFRRMVDGFTMARDIAVRFGQAMVVVGGVIKSAWDAVSSYLSPIIDFLVEKTRFLLELVDDAKSAAGDIGDLASDVISNLPGGQFINMLGGGSRTSPAIKKVFERAAEEKGAAAASPSRLRELIQPIGMPSGPPGGPSKIQVTSNLVMDGQRVAQHQQELDLENRARRSD